MPVGRPHDPRCSRGISWGAGAGTTNGHGEDREEESPVAGSGADEAAGEGRGIPDGVLPDEDGPGRRAVGVCGIVGDGGVVVGPVGRNVGDGARIIDGPSLEEGRDG